MGPGRFRFHGVEHEAGPDNWTPPGASRLWLYHLHYFDDLAAARQSWHGAWLTGWIGGNPPGARPAWEPYPLSRRIVRWAQWILAGNQPVPGMIKSLAEQTHWLSRTIEWHLLANHLFANGKGMVFAGCLLEGAAPFRWLDTGVRIIEAELAEQVLGDGGHIERSPMYHALMLEDVLDLLQLTGLYPGLFPSGWADRLNKTAAAMLPWLEAMSHPDGGVSFFNDSALHVAPEFAALSRYASWLGLSSRSHSSPVVLRESGYVRLESPGTVILFDVAPAGPDYQPGHAHADALSFELSHHGHRVLVNSGVSTYEPGSRRRKERGTASHNTIVIDGVDQSEVWGSFRLGRRARLFAFRTGSGAEKESWAEASHDGYRRLREGLVHHRRVSLRDGCCRVYDSLTGIGTHSAEIHYHLHPSVRPVLEAQGRIQLSLPDGSAAQVTMDPKWQVSMEDAEFSASFGEVVPTQRICGVWRGEAPVEFQTRLSFAIQGG